MYVCKSVCNHLCMFVCMHLFIYVFMCVCMCMYRRLGVVSIPNREIGFGSVAVRLRCVAMRSCVRVRRKDFCGWGFRWAVAVQLRVPPLRKSMNIHCDCFWEASWRLSGVSCALLSF